MKIYPKPMLFSILGLSLLSYVAYSTVNHVEQPKESEITSNFNFSDGEGELLVDFKDNPYDSELSKAEEISGIKLHWLYQKSGLAIGHTDNLSKSAALLQSDSDVEGVEPHIAYQAFADGEFPNGKPNDPLYEKQWHMVMMGAPTGWANTPRGKGITVAVVDTGVTKVEDLQQTTILEGKSFISSEPTSEDVISLSLGGSAPSSSIERAVKHARDNGVLVIAATGNSSREGVGYPAAFPGVIGVGSIGPDGILAPYSTWGKGTDITAPGGNKKIPGGGVWQDTIDGKGGHAYLEFQGTSMATPHVSGAAAVLLSTGMTPDRVEEVLLSSAEGTNHKWDPKYGFGKLSLSTALESANSLTVMPKLSQVLFTLLASILIVVPAKVSTEFKAKVIALSTIASNGLWMLSLIPFLPNNALTQALSDSILAAPYHLTGSRWAMNPLWISAALPLLSFYFLGLENRVRWLLTSFSIGAASYMWYGAIHGTVRIYPTLSDVINLPFLGYLDFSSFGWLIFNSALCLILSYSFVGVEKVSNKIK